MEIILFSTLRLCGTSFFLFYEINDVMLFEFLFINNAQLHMMVTHIILQIFEPPRGKTNNVVSEQVGHKPTCTSTEKS